MNAGCFFFNRAANPFRAECQILRFTADLLQISQHCRRIPAGSLFNNDAHAAPSFAFFLK